MDDLEDLYYEDLLIEVDGDWKLKAHLQTTGFVLRRMNKPILKLVCECKDGNNLIDLVPLCSYRFRKDPNGSDLERALGMLKDSFNFRLNKLKDVLIPLGFKYSGYGFGYEDLRITLLANEDSMSYGLLQSHLFLFDEKTRLISINVFNLLKLYASKHFENLPPEARDSLI